MSAAAIILARSGSKGLPGKNLRDIAGKPCVCWTIDAARAAMAAGAVARVALSADGPALAQIALREGIEFVERPASLAGDTARVDDAARHAVIELERAGTGDARCDPVVILYGNVPVRPRGLIERAVRTLRDTGAHSVQSYAPVGKHHPWWTAVVGERGDVRPWQGDVLNHGVFRRQDLPPAHVPDGGVIVVTRAALMLELGVPDGPHAFFGHERRGVVNAEGEVIDIDSEIDAMVADAVLRRGQRAEGGA
jgi:CMP-N,N'-diacetyllegionaminic acid synthase